MFSREIPRLNEQLRLKVEDNRALAIERDELKRIINELQFQLKSKPDGGSQTQRTLKDTNLKLVEY